MIPPHYLYRLAPSLNALSTGYMAALGLPTPAATPYKDYSVKTPTSNGGVAYHGFENAPIAFPTMSNTQFMTVKRIVLAALANGGRLYATIPRGDGTEAGGDWIDISGIPDIPDGNPIAGANGRVHGAIEIALNNVIVERDPAVFT